MKYLIPALMFLASCATPEPGNRKIDIVLRNTTPHPIEIRAHAGFLSRTIRLDPGETWTGWVPPSVPINEIRIEVVEPKPVR